ncbi:GntR family transcriptional regulator [Streptomyces sp. NPDC006658]|uniref:GntR family transcriptional regulator n=1 Tax=Streptomyces sp. NPDC006658 TaxID=3156900 RepID=UPI0033D0438F
MPTPGEPILVVLREEVRAGVWPAGALLKPSELMERFGTSRMLTRAALSVLIDEGLVRLDKSRTYIVLAPGSPPPNEGCTPTSRIDRVMVTMRERLAGSAPVYPPGRRLPPLHQLAVEFGVSKSVVLHAATRLMLQGLVRHQHAGEMRGLYAVDPKSTTRNDILIADLRAAMYRGGWCPADFREAVERALPALDVPPPVGRPGPAPAHSAGLSAALVIG